MAASSHSPGMFTFTRAKAFLALSLAITWWFASLLPHYQPMIEAELKSRLDEARQKIPSIKVDWHTPDDDPRNAYNSSKVALLIEPRPLAHLVPQILHMISVVPPDWRFLFIGSHESVVSVERAYATKHQQVIGKLDLMVLPEPWEIDSKEKTYRLLTDMRFYDEFLPGVEWILKYESDSILCANSESSLNDWLEWSWAGAPKKANDPFSGNGGLSIRRVSAIKRVLNFQARYNDTDPEDAWFGKRIYVLPGAKVAKGINGALAVEDMYIEKPMGYHVRDGGSDLKDEVWKDHVQRQKIFAYCPELSLIMDMKLDRERCAGDNLDGEIDEEIFQEAERQRIAEEEAARKKAEEEEAAKKKAEDEKVAKEKAAQEAEEQARKDQQKAKEEEDKAKEEEKARKAKGEEEKAQKDSSRQAAEESIKKAQEVEAKKASEAAARASSAAAASAAAATATTTEDGSVAASSAAGESSPSESMPSDPESDATVDDLLGMR